MKGLRRVKDLRELRQAFDSIHSTVAGDTRFSAQAVMALNERLARIETLLDAQLLIARRLLESERQRVKRPPTPWQSFFAAGMKAGKTPAQIGAEWQAQKP